MATLTESSVIEDYRERGLAGVKLDQYGCPSLATTLDVTAVHMPAGLGQRVLEDLRLRMIAGPVMARPSTFGGPDRWTVFCWENHTPRAEVVSELDLAGASICAMGSPLTLPAGYARVAKEPWWVQPPGAELPGLSAVIAVTQQMARGLGPW